MPEARDSGTICAVAGQGQRRPRRWAAAYPGLYPAEAFDPALYASVALAAAFGGPGYSAGDLRMANRACLWSFGLDWLVDYAATSEEEGRDIRRRCIDAGDGRAPDDELTRLPPSVRDAVGARPPS